MQKKGRTASNSETLKRFQEFMKKRLQKKSILHSNEPINKKIECFEELLKLTKAGQTLNHQYHKVPVECARLDRSNKNIVERKRQEHQSEENTQIVLGRLDKMVHDTNGWTGSRKTSEHQQADKKWKNSKQDPSFTALTPFEEKKSRKIDYKSTKVSRMIYGSNVQEFATEDIQEIQQRPGYAPYRKKHYLTRHSSSRNVINNKIGASRTIDLSIKMPDFSILKNQITEYETRAKEVYGLNFQLPKSKECAQQMDDVFEMREANKEMMRVISLNQFKRTAENPYQQLVKEHTREDSSVPANLLGIIRSSSAKTRKKMTFSTNRSRYIRV